MNNTKSKNQTTSKNNVSSIYNTKSTHGWENKYTKCTVGYLFSFMKTSNTTWSKKSKEHTIECKKLANVLTPNVNVWKDKEGEGLDVEALHIVDKWPKVYTKPPVCITKRSPWTLFYLMVGQYKTAFWIVVQTESSAMWSLFCNWHWALYWAVHWVNWAVHWVDWVEHIYSAESSTPSRTE